VLDQDGGSQRALHSQQAQQDVFDADVVLLQPIGLLPGVFEGAFYVRAERDLDRNRHRGLADSETGTGQNLSSNRLK
jgi:hypothetical protein